MHVPACRVAAQAWRTQTGLGERKQIQLPYLEREEPRKSTALPLDIARSVVVVWFNGVSGTCGQFRDIEKDCIAGPCLWGLRGSDGEMCVGVFLRRKAAVVVVLLFVVFFALAATQSFGTEALIHSILPGFREDENRVGQAKIQEDFFT